MIYHGETSNTYYTVQTPYKPYPRAQRALIFSNKDTSLSVARQWVEEVLEELRYSNIPPMRFDKKAGCNCGCTPGFILLGELKNGAEIYIAHREEEKEEVVYI